MLAVTIHHRLDALLPAVPDIVKSLAPAADRTRKGVIPGRYHPRHLDEVNIFTIFTIKRILRIAGPTCRSEARPITAPATAAAPQLGPLRPGLATILMLNLTGLAFATHLPVPAGPRSPVSPFQLSLRVEWQCKLRPHLVVYASTTCVLCPQPGAAKGGREWLQGPTACPLVDLTRHVLFQSRSLR